jgi:hypothetical protein
VAQVEMLVIKLQGLQTLVVAVAVAVALLLLNQEALVVQVTHELLIGVNYYGTILRIS